MSFLLGTATGLVIGGAYGLLHTPRKGKENREYLKTYANDVKNQSEVVKQDFDHLNRSVNTLKHELDMVQGPISAEFKAIANQYQLELEPRLARIQARQEELNKSLDNL